MDTPAAQRKSPTPQPPALFSGWPLLGVIAALLGAMAIAILAAMPGVDGIRMLIRATARTSVTFFLLAFLASAAWSLWPGAATRWVRANRRQLGLAFAISHLIHAGAIYALSREDPALFAQLVMPGTFITGGSAYLLLLLMAATSFDTTAAWLGRRNWRVLHTVGIWYLWVSFMVTFGKRVSQGPFYAVMMAVLLAALGVRITAFIAARMKARAAQPALKQSSSP